MLYEVITPVLIDLTKDAQFGELEFEYKKCTKVRSYRITSYNVCYTKLLRIVSKVLDWDFLL